MSAVKLICKPYSNKFSTVDKLLSRLIASDKKKNIETIVIYPDDKQSAARVNIRYIKMITRESCKSAIDEIFKKFNPAYLVIFGAQDIIPFQEINNPCEDFDTVVPSDLPYACEAAFSKDIASFTGPSRVVGRIPDIPASADINYLKTIMETIINYKSVKPEKLLNYFSVTADVWKKSTQQTVINIFGNSTRLITSPSKIVSYTKSDIKPLTHFYNCHGSPDDHKYYGQKGKKYPIAQNAPDLEGKISEGTIVAAECCYGAQLFDPQNNSKKK
ncbi:hypothetical protein BH09BAC2_BH09BAC2_13660 [soil metagenome]